MTYLLLKVLHVVGAAVILGTGVGIAFFMLMAHLSRNAEFIGRTAGVVVIADMLFTATAVIAQPVTGLLLMRATGASFSESWLVVSLALYLIAGIFWLPVVWMQMRMRDLALGAVAAKMPLPADYYRLFQTLVLIRISRVRRSVGDYSPDGHKTGSVLMTELRVAIFGASGLIGQSLALDLIQRGFLVRAFARHFTRAQRAALQGTVHIVQLDAVTPEILADVDVVINCVGVLQDGPSGKTNEVHGIFAARLSGLCAPAKLLIHLSIPDAGVDATAFSRSKRDAEAVILQGGSPFVILRPGFVVGSNAYGGSALLRALAALPIRLPPKEANAPFAAVAMEDVCETVNLIVLRWRNGKTSWSEIWDLMESRPGRVCEVLEAFRTQQGGPRPWFTLPSWLLAIGAGGGDILSWLNWKPPVRSTALSEMRRGVSGDPTAWIRATGIVPRAAVPGAPITVQDAWFVRLYFLKAIALVTLVIFWCVSGLISLSVAFLPARDILTRHGFNAPAAQSITFVSSLADIVIGLTIAWRPVTRFGLIAGIALSIFYMAMAAILAPDMWAEPLGALVKTGPAVVLMAMCLAILKDRP